MSEGGQNDECVGKRHIWWPHILVGIEPVERMRYGGVMSLW